MDILSTKSKPTRSKAAVHLREHDGAVVVARYRGLFDNVFRFVV
jgi:hypothetical protein